MYKIIGADGKAVTLRSSGEVAHHTRSLEMCTAAWSFRRL